VSVEDYCAYMGQLVGIEPSFDYTPEAHTPLWPDVTYMHQLLGRTKVSWRDGFRRMIRAATPNSNSPPLTRPHERSNADAVAGQAIRRDPRRSHDG